MGTRVGRRARWHRDHEIDWGGGNLAVNQIIDGKILRVDEEHVLVDVGYKSEGTIPAKSNGKNGKNPPRSATSLKC